MQELDDDKKDLMGYSHASYQILKALERAGFDCLIDDPRAFVAISMGFPSDYEFYDYQYKIGYTAWESTELKPGWKEKMLAVDQLWATSSWTANVFKEQTGREDIHVYPHGIDMSWKPLKRYQAGPFRFLHVGEPHVRKNAQEVVNAFVRLFGDNPDYQLVLKCTNINTTRVFWPDGSIAGGPDSKYQNIKIITNQLSHDAMVELFHKSHAMIYPSTGEGFGFIPLQALATGMPVASTTPWAEYNKFITVPINSTLSPSEYPNLHPGNVYNVSQEDIEKSMLDLVSDYDSYAKQSYKNSFHVHMEYDWDAVTQPTAKLLKKLFKNS